MGILLFTVENDSLCCWIYVVIYVVGILEGLLFIKVSDPGNCTADFYAIFKAQILFILQYLRYEKQWYGTFKIYPQKYFSIPALENGP